MNTKVIIFDFDGTLTISKSSTWARVWEKVNALDVDEKLYNMYTSKLISYDEWLKLGAKEIGSRGYSINDLHELISNSKLIDNVEDVFKFCKLNNIKIYILSGGIRKIIVKTLNNLTSYVQHIEAPDFLFDENGILCGAVGVNHNPENKQEFVWQIIEKENVNPKEVLFVGNGKNDETIYLTGANTLCLNADGADFSNKTIWHNAIESETLKDILPFISCQNKI